MLTRKNRNCYMEMKICGLLLALLGRIILTYTPLLPFWDCSKLWYAWIISYFLCDIHNSSKYVLIVWPFFRLRMRRVLQRFMSCSRVKCFGPLVGAPYLIAYPFMMRSSNNPSRVLEACCLNSRRVMRKHWLLIWMSFRRFANISAALWWPSSWAIFVKCKKKYIEESLVLSCFFPHFLLYCKWLIEVVWNYL